MSKLYKILFFFLTFYFSTNLAIADDVNINLGDLSDSFTSKIVEIIALITILSIAPSILIMITSFTRIIVVLSFLRSALGLQQTPPNTVLISLALFLTLYIMGPTFNESYKVAIKPLMDDKMEITEAIPKMSEPFHKFMRANLREKDLQLFHELAGAPEIKDQESLPYNILIPSFMLGELKRAFEIGFLIFIPFLIIDMLVASTLMAVGMMMLPPIMISMPFKIIFFVLVDGWYMIAGSLVKSFITI